MCGICGLISNSELSERDISGVAGMNRALTHRGPDSSGFYSDVNLALAMRRLKIIDLEGGNQPLFNEDGALVLIVNGEVYNHIELKEELEKKGHFFKTRSDCETILHLYEEEGVKCLHRLRGMFAFALYDKEKGLVFMARDRLGEKPFYYHKTDTEFVFSSEMKSLLAYLRPKGIKPNPDAINMYLHYQYVPEPLTCIEGVNKLPAGHYMTVRLRDLSSKLEKYWDIEDAEPVTGSPSKLIRHSFDDLSRTIIRADVPVGVALSGGVDSAAIACFAAKHYKERMHVFSVGYSGRPKNDERAMAKELADRIGLTFHDVELKTEELAASFPRLVFHMDDPIADIAAFGYYAVHKLAREHGVPVVLNGFGGDELFWGYDWVRRAVGKNFDKLKMMAGSGTRGTSLRSVLEVTSHMSKKAMLSSPMNSAKKIISGVRAEQAKLSEHPGRFIFYDELPDFVSAFDYKGHLATDAFMDGIDDERLYSFFTDDDWERIPIKICKFLFQTWLNSNCVALGDRMSMASSVESRLPFLDYRLVELTMGLRKTYTDDYMQGHKKWFIEAMDGIIQPEVLKRKKRGFSPPVAEWYRAVVSRYGGLCLKGCLVENSILRQDRVAEFLDNSLTDIRALFFSYKLILIEIWLRLFLMGDEHV